MEEGGGEDNEEKADSEDLWLLAFVQRFKERSLRTKDRAIMVLRPAAMSNKA